MKITICPKKIFKKNLYLILILLAANIIGLFATRYLDHELVHGLVRYFDFNTEKNIPTFYSAIALLISGFLLFFIALTPRKSNTSYRPWFWLAAIFVFLSLDEMVSIHEHLIEPVRATFKTSGLLFYAWVIPYGIALVIFIMAYAKFLLELPKSIMILFLISGSIFVSGAIGFELLGGNQKYLFGNNSVLYCVFYTCEEFLEMLGIAIFIYTLLTYIGDHFEQIAFSIKNNN